MNPLSSIPPTPPGDTSSSPPKKTILSSCDASHEVPALAPNSPKEDRISPSTHIQEVACYLEQMSKIPDMRQDKIAHFQKVIDAQNYVISAEKLADSLIQKLHPHPEDTDRQPHNNFFGA